MPPLFLSQQVVFFQRMTQLIIAEVERFGGLPLIVPAFGKCLLQNGFFKFLGRLAKVSHINRLTKVG